MMKPVAENTDNGSWVWEKTVNDLVENNVYVPTIKNIIFSLSAPNEKRSYPVLATAVFFDDGTKVVVKNTETDPIEIVKAKLEDGSEIDVASDASKERSVVYAIFKRICGTPDEKGTITNSGHGRILHELVDGAHDTNLEAAERKVAERKAQKPASVSKSAPKISLKSTLTKLNEILDKLAAKFVV